MEEEEIPITKTKYKFQYMSVIETPYNGGGKPETALYIYIFGVCIYKRDNFVQLF